MNVHAVAGWFYLLPVPPVLTEIVEIVGICGNALDNVLVEADKANLLLHSIRILSIKTVLRIRDVYLGSRIRPFFFYPGSGSYKKEGGNKRTFFMQE
jgi:hypothetical protein